LIKSRKNKNKLQSISFNDENLFGKCYSFLDPKILLFQVTHSVELPDAYMDSQINFTVVPAARLVNFPFEIVSIGGYDDSSCFLHLNRFIPEFPLDRSLFGGRIDGINDIIHPFQKVQVDAGLGDAIRGDNWDGILGKFFKPRKILDIRCVLINVL